MAKDNTFQRFRPTSKYVDEEFYTAADIDQIIAAAGGLPEGEVKHRRLESEAAEWITVTVPRRVALEERLQRAARAYSARSEMQQKAKPTPKQIANHFKQIEREAEKLIDLLGMESRDGDARTMFPALRLGGDQALDELEKDELGRLDPRGNDHLLQRAVSGIYFLRDWAARAKEHNAEQGLKKPGERKLADHALDKFLTSLVAIWSDLFGREPGTSFLPEARPGGEAGGPLVRFVEACSAPLGVTLSRGAIRDRLRRKILQREDAEGPGGKGAETNSRKGAGMPM